MKKRILTLAALMICLATFASGTLAYFTVKDKAHNVITSSNVGIELIEKTIDKDGTKVDFPSEGISGVMPGDSVSKIVSIENTGKGEAWIRVWVNTAVSEQGNPITNPTIKNLPLEITVNGKTIPVISYEVDESKWIYEDGYYYYKQPVPSEKSTDILFDEVHFAKEMGNEYQNCKVMIDISAEAVQTANNLIPDGGDVTDVKGWPED